MHSDVLPSLSFSLNSLIPFFPVDSLFYFFCSLLSDDPVGGHFFKCLKILHYCNYTNQVFGHIMYALYIPELTGHVQSDRALFINISTL